MAVVTRRFLAGLGGAIGMQALSVARPAAASAPAACPVDHDGTRPAEIYRSETFTVQWRDRLLRIDIGYPLPVDPGIELMIRGAKPVPVYVLDSWTNFPMAVSTTRLMQWGGEVPPCLVVGIGYADIAIADRDNWRTRDLTPTTDPGDYQPLPGESFGAGPDLRRFLLETLRPMVERRFDIDASRAVLCGHSLGGLFVLDTMVQTPGGFGNYLAISPSLWFGRTIVLKQLAAKLSSGVTFPARVAVFAGEQEERISEPRYHMTSNTLEFGRLVADHRKQFSNGALVSIVPGATHHSIMGEAMARGLRFLIAPEDRRDETF